MTLLRNFVETDAGSLLLHANDPKVSVFLTTRFPYPYTISDAEKFIAYAQTFNPPEILAITCQNEAIGAIGLHPQKDLYTKTIELGYWVSERHRNKGITTEAVALGISHAKQHWHFNRIVARVFAGNTASQKVLFKNGFIQEAAFKNAIYKNGAFHDEYVFCLHVAGLH